MNLNHEFKHSKLRNDLTFNLYVFLLSLTTWRSQRATRALLKKIKKFQEIQDSWIQDKKYNIKKNIMLRNFLFWKSRQKKKCSLRQEILSWWDTNCYWNATERSSIIDRNIIILTVVFNAQYDLGRHGFISAARQI